MDDSDDDIAPPKRRLDDSFEVAPLEEVLTSV
jgi:hypothetical protein